ncbi:hypothetical protein [Isobaculum melis]|nr:hypothetical protein [Isobaculum melis]
MEDIIEKRKQLAQIEEDELFLIKQRNQLEELEDDFIHLQRQEKELLSILEESWQSHQGRSCLYETEEQAFEQQRAFQQDMVQKQDQLDERKKDLLYKRIQTEATLEQLKRDVRT